MAKHKKIPKSIRKHVNRTMRRRQCLLFMVVLTVGFLLSWIFPLRPMRSESEKRDLSPFPALTFKSLCSGDFFDGINLWFSDTFPFREQMVAANSKIKSLYGFGTRIYGLTDEIADEIPEEPNVPVIQTIEDSNMIDETIGGSLEVNDALVQNLGTVVVVNDSAFEVYNFIQSVADKYASSVNRCAQTLEGISDVYDLIVPTSVDITMPDNERAKINSSNQAEAMRYIFSCMAPQVHSVNVYNILRSHRTEYIYFRTDHHWTALGAYYAYTQFCRSAQMQAQPLNSFTLHKYSGFKGSFVAETKKNPMLVNNPDTVYAYDPSGEITMTFTSKSGNKQEWPVITDVTDWYSSEKYCTFINGDNPYTVIINHSTSEQKKCLVVKESFGNAFVPFLAASFSEVHVVDYRYWNGNVNSFAKENGIDCVLFINNISATRNSSLMNALQKTTY